jgi:predicted anti-sigma-YlaC factor YlaD
MDSMRGIGWLLLLSALACSPERWLADRLGRALTGGQSLWNTDEDVELVREALPFALKTLESLVAASPQNPDLQLAACRGFATYALGFVALEAEELPAAEFLKAQEVRDRARRLLRRAREYCFAAWDRWLPLLAKNLREGREIGLAQCQARHVPALYWTAVVWGGALSMGIDDPNLVVDLPLVRALLERAHELDPSFERGAIAELLLVFDALPESMGGSPERARAHYEEAVRASGNRRASPHVTWAVHWAIPRQDRQEFEAALLRALAVEEASNSPDRLSNELTRRRARLLLNKAEELFF